MGDNDLPLDPEQFLSLPRFLMLSSKSKEAIRDCSGAMAIRRYQAGKAICEEGAPGRSAFYLLSEIDRFLLTRWVEANEPDWLPRYRRPGFCPADPGRSAILADSSEAECAIAGCGRMSETPSEQSRCRTALESRRPIPPEDEAPLFAVPFLDELLARSANGHPTQPVAHLSHRPEVVMYPRELIGEMALRNREPRKATVVACADLFAIELLGNVFDALREDEVFGNWIESEYVRRIQENHLRTLPLLRCLSDQQFAQFFANPVGLEIRSFDTLAGGVICEENQPAGELFLIRKGLVQVTVQGKIIAYRKQGEFIGELALFPQERIASMKRGEPLPEQMPDPGRRTATCSAIAHPREKPRQRMGRVEVVCIPYSLFWAMARSPDADELRQEIIRVAERRYAQFGVSPSSPEVIDGPAVLLSPSVKPLGLYMGRQLMLIDERRCTGCDECVRACVASHKDGRTRLYLEGPRAELADRPFLIPRTCRSCEDPVCLMDCPTTAIQRGNRGQIDITPEMCIGCGACANSCPYGSIQIHDTGLIPEPASDWYFFPKGLVAEKQLGAWCRAESPPTGWIPARTPLRVTRDVQDQLRRLRQRRPQFDPTATQRVLFWRRFALPEPPRAGVGDSDVRLTVQGGRVVAAWVDGKIVPMSGASPWQFSLPVRSNPWASATLALELEMPLTLALNKELIASLRLDQLDRPRGEWLALNQRAQPQVAVVCDQCQQLPQGPACVRACPHNATRRFDATQNLLVW